MCAIPFQKLVARKTVFPLLAAGNLNDFTLKPTFPLCPQGFLNCLLYTSIEQIEAARELVEALSLDQRIWVDDAMLSKLDSLIQFRSDCNELITAIDAIGTVTEANHTDCLSLIQSAEHNLQHLISTYGEEAAAAVTNRDALTAARTEYDRIVKEIAEREEEARRAAIQKAIDAITAIGAVADINEENVDAKQALVEAAEQAVKELTDAYGQDIVSEEMCIRDRYHSSPSAPHKR